jgi:hypothetical protein
MIVYSALGITLIISLWCLISAGTAKASLKQSWSRLAAVSVLAIFIYLYGCWVYLSIFAKYAFGLIFFAIVLYALFRSKEEGLRLSAWKFAGNLIAIAVFGVLSILYFTGTVGTPERISLAFPLKKGSYFVLQGGKGLPTNIFHYKLRGAVFAMDIVKLNSYGNRANKVFSSRLEDYDIFGDTVYSPCDGRVLKAISDDEDNIPPNMERGPNNTNQVLMETDGAYVFMGHFKHGGTFVHAGDHVKQGQPLGLVGNSGFSLEPHLHIQVHAKTNDGEPWYRGRPLYPGFGGKSYLLNEVIRP